MRRSATPRAPSAATERTSSDWPPAGAVPPLESGDVHVWLVRLDVGPARLRALQALLDPAERARAERPVTEALRRRWVAARGTLREILAAYRGEPAARLRLAYGEHGKPRLVDPDAAPHFNLAHTGDVALVAVSHDDVGVDVEREREVDLVAVSERMFSPAERAALLALPDGERRHGFFACWSYKESYVKAHGDGLTIDTTRFDAWRPHLGDGDRARVHDAATTEHWEIEALRPIVGHPAAVCARGPGWRVVRLEWTGWAGPPDPTPAPAAPP